MAYIHLEADKTFMERLDNLKRDFHVATNADVFRKAIDLLEVAAFVNKTQGELIAKKGNHERKILVD